MSRLPMRVTTMVLSSFAMIGCASLAAPNASSNAAPNASPNGSPDAAPGAMSTAKKADVPMLGNEVSGTELTASGASTLYDALVRTRRQYFSARGVNTMQVPAHDQILVFRAGMLMGEINVLKMLRPTDVRFVRRLSAVDTYYKYGKQVTIGGLEIELVNE